MSTPTDEERLDRLALQALIEVNISERDQTNWLPPFLGGTTAYWQRTSTNEIELVFRTAKFGSGRLDCSIYLKSLFTLETKTHHSDEDLVRLIVAILKYLRVSISEILPWLGQHLMARTFNQLPPETQDILERSGLMTTFQRGIDSHLTQTLTAAIKELRAEPQRKRGGSEPRLEDSERTSLHLRYDNLHQTAKRVKRDYNSKLNRFSKSRKGKGYTHGEWRDFWMKEADGFPDDIKNFMALFAELDSPSASEVAYKTLAAQTGYTESYLVRLVGEMRKAAKSSDNQKDC